MDAAPPSSEQPLIIRASSFVQHIQESIHAHYVLTKLLGSGKSGQVFLAVHRATRQKRAIKEVPKANAQDTAQSKFIREVEVLGLIDHPNVLKVYELLEGPDKYYIVTDACEGGHLFDYIVSKRSMSEQTAAHVMYQVLSALCYCHEKKIVHRNLTPENLLIDNSQKGGEVTIKVGDFALAGLMDESGRVTGQFTVDGPYYTAPEVFTGAYTEKCDIWSCGVLLYVMLSAMPPFDGADDQAVVEAIRAGRVQFPEEQWGRVSPEARQFITRMLELDAERRPSAMECLNDPWMTSYRNRTLSTEALNPASLANLQRFQSGSHLRKAFMSFIASQVLSKDHTAQLKAEFQALDTDGNGRLSREELLHGYSRYLPEADANALITSVMATVDTDGSGSVEYSEFLAAAASHESLLSRQNLEVAFEACDTDHSGTLSASELRSLFGAGAGDQQVWDKLIADADKNGDGEIDMKEFLALMLQAQQL